MILKNKQIDWTWHDICGIFGSLSVHLGLFAVLAWSIGVVQSKIVLQTVSTSSLSELPAPVIQAVTIDPQLVAQEVKKIEQKTKQALQQKKQFSDSQAQLRIEQKKLIQEKAQLNQLKSELELLKKQTREKSEILTLEQKKLKETLATQQKQSEKLAEQASQQELRKQAIEESHRKLEQLEQQVAQRRVAQIAQEYILRIQNKVKNNHQYLLHLPSDLKTEISFFLAKNGEIRNLKIIASSGSDKYDQATMIAIQKSIPFEMPDDPQAVEHLSREIILGFTNEHTG